MKIAPTLRLATASLLILTACAGAQTSTSELWKQIQAANTDLTCDNSSQCHSLGVGAKACGGPENYLAWSSKNSDGAKLKALVEQHSAARRADDKKQGIMSTCSVVSDPGASCRAGVCVLNERSLVPPSGQPNVK
ncbi:hypothetical protein GTP46_00200 [Duganella sp. FT135W]|uniref:DUF4189 domain-containing protein n=1 Tax=Duganella flavida TaxID=2692175 RepID=A0A6L8K1K3_9BURK|nr:hypothetical protein [Duganella flavida]MYM21070.1 hypothetical protein [Duganella flavida]